MVFQTLMSIFILKHSVVDYAILFMRKTIGDGSAGNQTAIQL